MAELVMGFVIMLGTPAYLVLQAWAAFSSRQDLWRAIMLAPLLLAVPIAVWCIYALTQESNLWPLPFILFAPLGAGYLLVMLFVRSQVGRA